MTARRSTPLLLCLFPLLVAGSVRAQTARGQADLLAEFQQGLAEFDEAQSAQAREPERARGLFRSAAQRFASLVGAGIVNGRLEYNLANCYLQSGDVGRAILHYRRAERLIPRDPLLRANLSVAHSRCLTSIAPSRGSEFLRSLFFWHYQTSLTGRKKAALLFYVAVWLLLIARNFFRRRAVAVGAIACAIVAAAAAGSVATQRWTDRNAPTGVVTDIDVVVYKGPGTGYQRQFEQPLQPGVEFTRREQTRAGWWRIELADGKSGWIEAPQAELVPTNGA